MGQGVVQVFSKKYKNQLLVTLAVNIITFSHGVALGWVAPTLLLLQSHKSPLRSGPITTGEASWIGSSVALGAILGIFIFGTCVNKIGRKRTILFLGLPHFCFWITVYFGTQVYHFFIARISAGLSGGGLFSTIPLFIAEISDKDIRGTLGTLFVLIMNLGVLTGFILTTYLEYRMVPLVIMWIPIFFMVCVTYIYDSPLYLLRNDKVEEAEASLKFYINYKSRSATKLQQISEEFAKQRANLIENKTEITKEDFCTEHARRGIIISIYLMVLNQCSSVFAIINYSSIVFSHCETFMEPNKNTIVIGVVQILGSCTTIALVDQCGRKVLLIVSASGTSISLTTMGLHMYFHTFLPHWNWIPLVTISLAIYLASIGIIPLPFVIMPEVIPPKIRSVVAPFCTVSLFITAFTVLKMYPLILSKMKVYGTMWVFGGFCALSLLFIIFFVPETRGKTVK